MAQHLQKAGTFACRTMIGETHPSQRGCQFPLRKIVLLGMAQEPRSPLVLYSNSPCRLRTRSSSSNKISTTHTPFTRFHTVFFTSLLYQWILKTTLNRPPSSATTFCYELPGLNSEALNLHWRPARLPWWAWKETLIIWLSSSCLRSLLTLSSYLVVTHAICGKC